MEGACLPRARDTTNVPPTFVENGADRARRARSVRPASCATRPGEIQKTCSAAPGGVSADPYPDLRCGGRERARSASQSPPMTSPTLRQQAARRRAARPRGPLRGHGHATSLAQRNSCASHWDLHLAVPWSPQTSHAHLCLDWHSARTASSRSATRSVPEHGQVRDHSAGLHSLGRRPCENESAAATGAPALAQVAGHEAGQGAPRPRCECHGSEQAEEEVQLQQRTTRQVLALLRTHGRGREGAPEGPAKRQVADTPADLALQTGRAQQNDARSSRAGARRTDLGLRPGA